VPISDSNDYKTAMVLLLTSTNPTYMIEDSATFTPPLEPRKYEKRFFGWLYSSDTTNIPGLVASSLGLMYKYAQTMTKQKLRK
jgi:hypothetical protein